MLSFLRTLFFSLTLATRCLGDLGAGYQVPYVADFHTCKLASSDVAYRYSILAEDYMVQTNLISTIGAR